MEESRNNTQNIGKTELDKNIAEIRLLFTLVCRKEEIEKEIASLFFKHISSEEKLKRFNNLHKTLCTINSRIESATIFTH